VRITLVELVLLIISCYLAYWGGRVAFNALGGGWIGWAGGICAFLLVGVLGIGITVYLIYRFHW